MNAPRIRISPSGCWEWQAAKDGQGYARVAIERKLYSVARVVCGIFIRALKPGECALHSCDNPACVNPTHLFIGTQATNVRDCANKGRNWNVRARRLTVEKVCEIRSQFHAGKATQTQLAARYKCSLATINDIVLERTWINVAFRQRLEKFFAEKENAKQKAPARSALAMFETQEAK